MPDELNPEQLAGEAFQTLWGAVGYYFVQIILPAAAFIVGAFFFYGVAKYFTAYGDEAKAESAKKTITWAVIGALVVLLSFAIIKWVGALLGENLEVPTPFEIPTI